MCRQRGFTLIELLMAIMIIGLLASIAIPVFNGQRTKAKNSQATSNLTNAFISGRQEYDSKGEWGVFGSEAVLVVQMSANEQAFNYRAYNPNNQSPASQTVSGWSQGPRDVSVSVEDPDMITMCTKSTTRFYFCLRADSLAGLPSGGSILRSTGSTEPQARAALASRCSSQYTYPSTMTSTAYPTTAYICSAGAINTVYNAPEWVSSLAP